MRDTLAGGTEWPEYMTQKTAAAYLDMSARTFRRTVDVECSAGRYSRAELDAWWERQRSHRLGRTA